MTAKDIKILGVTLTYNNEDKIPYVMPYYERMKIDKLIVYDNQSTDRTVEMLKKYPFVEIRSYYTERYSEDLVREFKQNVQDEFRGQYHWCISTYFDEVFYAERDFREVLYDKMCEGKTYFMKTGLNLFSRTFPPTDNGKLIHENIGRGSLWTADDDVIGIYGSKIELFDMNKLYVTYNENGCHQCALSGLISPFEDEISFFHIKFIDFNFIVESSKLYSERTKDTDIACYDYFVDNMEKVYDMMEKKAISVETYMNSTMKKLLPEQVIFLINETDEAEQRRCVDLLYKGLMSGIYRQCTVFFYGKSECDQNTWYYAMNNYHLFIFVDPTTDDPRTAVKNYGYRFENTIIKNPWIVEINKDELNDETLFYDVEHKLKPYALTDTEVVNMRGLKFIRYNRFISLNSDVTLGCYMIVKDEEKCIEKCLDSIINLCDEIVVVDTGCKDRTMEIVREYGYKVKTYYFEWCNDFSAARNFAMSKIHTTYSFTVDADEEFSPLLKETVLRLKDNAFFYKDSCELWLLNYNGTETPGYYLGGRQIVKNSPNNEWKYKIHEKLYYEGSNLLYTDKNDGYILHKHVEKQVSNSNYPKYAESYYNTINGLDAFSASNGAHFFYYLFFTLKEIDEQLAKSYLSELFNGERILMNNENQIVNLLKDNYISFEEFTAMSVIGNRSISHSQLADFMKEIGPKLILLKKAYDSKEPLSEDGCLTLAYNSYVNGDIKTFRDVTYDYCTIYPNNQSIIHNVKFCDNYINNFIKKTLVIDCTNGANGLPSNIYYFRKIFDNIKIRYDDKEKLKGYNTLGCSIVDGPCDGIVVDGNEHMNPQKAVKIFEDHMYNRNGG